MFLTKTQLQIAAGNSYETYFRHPIQAHTKGAGFTQ
jgi:hypothetical protein